MLQSEFKTPGSRVALRVCALRVVGQVLDSADDRRGQRARRAHQRRQNRGQNMTHAHRDAARGDRPMGNALGHMRTIPAQGRRAQRRPDESLGDVRVAGREGFQVGKRFPRLEKEFNLPAQAIAVADVLDVEIGALESGDQVARFVFPRVGIGEETALSR